MTLTKCVGCILGGMCGDVLGATVEGAHADVIARKYPHGLTVYDKFGPRAYGAYTDDSQMTLALIQSLVKSHGVCDAKDCATSYANSFQIHRGYGDTATRIMCDLKQGADYSVVAIKYFPEGSYANGGAMRIAPIGLLYSIRPQNEMRQAVIAALKCTHTHAHAIEGAYIQAETVSYMYKSHILSFNEKHLLDYLRTITSENEMMQKIIALEQVDPVIVKDWGAYLKTNDWSNELSMRYTLAEKYQIRALDAVACALLAVCRHWKNPVNAVLAAVHYGGDTDTVASMTGNIIFALWGHEMIPNEWLENLEDKSRAIELSTQLFQYIQRG